MKNYILIETDEVYAEIIKHIHTDAFIILKSKYIYRLYQYPFSNILCTPAHLSSKMVDLLESNHYRFKSIKKSDVQGIIKYIELTNQRELISSAISNY